MRCKPGVLAFIVRDPFPENIGRVVRVVSPAEPIFGCAAWTVQADGSPLRVLNLSTRAVTCGCDGDCRDVDLRPVSGVPVEDELPEEVAA